MPRTEWKIKDRQEAGRMRYQLRRFKNNIAVDCDNAKTVLNAIEKLMIEIDGMVDIDDDGAIMDSQ